jgi:Ca-activated chloride channel family protein
MKRSMVASLLIVGILVVATLTAMVFASGGGPYPQPSGPPTAATDGVVSLSGKLIQDKVTTGSDGIVSLALSLTAADIPAPAETNSQPVDMVIVLDKSGSMNGEKMAQAKRAVSHLVSALTARDRLGIVAYSDSTLTLSSLMPVTGDHANRLERAVTGISAAGATNLGAGLDRGLSFLTGAKDAGRLGKLILISDGLANRGVTDPAALGRMAAAAVAGEFSVSTVGVGVDFNEILMTRIADRGAGRYYFLENPAAFAEVFLNEFRSLRLAAAANIAVEIPLPPGTALLDAAGFPFEQSKNTAVFHPGDLQGGRTRKFFLRFRIPTGKETTFRLTGIRATYTRNGRRLAATLPSPLTIACVADESAAVASIDKTEWKEQVLKNDYNRLRQEVARDIQTGKKESALSRIRSYFDNKRSINATVQSPEVTQNLETDVADLENSVREAFSGTAEESARRRNQTGKRLQFKGYAGQRDLSESTDMSAAGEGRGK